MNTAPQIMVIDDDAIIGRSFDRVLSQEGYDVSTAFSGKEALDLIDNKDYDVIFTDIRMPEMDGFEVAERLKVSNPQTPIVFITGYGTEENREKADMAGAFDFICKPFTPEIIKDVTLKVLQKKEEFAIEIEEPEVEEISTRGGFKVVAKDVGLFFASPFIALGYIIALPFVGFYMFSKFGIEKLSSKE